jgi:hypothetical protein
LGQRWAFRLGRERDLLGYGHGGPAVTTAPPETRSPGGRGHRAAPLGSNNARAAPRPYTTRRRPTWGPVGCSRRRGRSGRRRR